MKKRYNRLVHNIHTDIQNIEKQFLTLLKWYGNNMQINLLDGNKKMNLLNGNEQINFLNGNKQKNLLGGN